MRFYGIDITREGAVEPARFFALAHRLPAYEGIMRLRVEAEQEERKKRTPGARNPSAQVVDISEMSEFIEMK